MKYHCEQIKSKQKMNTNEKDKQKKWKTEIFWEEQL